LTQWFWRHSEAGELQGRQQLNGPASYIISWSNVTRIKCLEKIVRNRVSQLRTSLQFQKRLTNNSFYCAVKVFISPLHITLLNCKRATKSKIRLSKQRRTKVGHQWHSVAGEKPAPRGCAVEAWLSQRWKRIYETDQLIPSPAKGCRSFVLIKKRTASSKAIVQLSHDNLVSLRKLKLEIKQRRHWPKQRAFLRIYLADKINLFRKWHWEMCKTRL